MNYFLTGPSTGLDYSVRLGCWSEDSKWFQGNSEPLGAGVPVGPVHRPPPTAGAAMAPGSGLWGLGVSCDRWSLSEVGDGVAAAANSRDHHINIINVLMQVFF